MQFITNNACYQSARLFLRQKNVSLSAKVYFIDVMSYMALGLFSSLLIGSIFNSIGMKFEIALFTDTLWPLAKQMLGPAVGVAIAYGLNAPPLVLFASVITGAAGEILGGPVGAYVAALIGAELGKCVAGATKIDILLTPALTILSGIGVATAIGPYVHWVMSSFGDVISSATQLQPMVMGALVAVLMGMALTLPISSAAIAIMLSLNGLAAGAATVGCATQMIGFAVISWRENGWGGFVAQGLGTSMLQLPNIIRNYKIWLPTIITSAILGPMATVLFQLENTALGAGMGTSGLVGQIQTIIAMDHMPSLQLYSAILLLHFILPAMLSLIIANIMRRKGWIKAGDLKLTLA